MKTFLRRNLIYLVGGLLVINIVLLFFSLFAFPQKVVTTENLKIIFLDVGQGDAILLKTAEGQNVLVDGGPDKSIIYKLDQYIPFYQRNIDLMILTHPDPDHLNGLIEVLKRYQVRSFIFNGVDDESVDYQQFLKKIDELGIKKEIVWQGKKINLIDGYLDFLFPGQSLAGQNLKDDNEGSLIFKLVFGGKKILFVGDATQKVENQLLKEGIDLSADILKVGHHGSKSSTGTNFLGKVKPIYAVISVGKDNKYGHPNLRVLKNLEDIQVQVLRTDQLSDIIFEIDGTDLIKK